MKQRSERMFVQILCKSKKHIRNINAFEKVIVIFLEKQKPGGILSVGLAQLGLLNQNNSFTSV